jgi:Asp-tRNA(Asn)/Glu-tRNA(Gln) amidotransferase C subunit
MKKISIDDLIKRNIDKEKIETFELEIAGLDGVITCKTLPESEILDIFEQLQKIDTQNIKETMKFNNKIVYDCIVDPNLKDEKLQKHYQIKAEPYEIVSKIFTLTEIQQISDLLAEKLGLGATEEKAVKLIKKQ